MELWIEGTIDEVVDVANRGLVNAIATNPSIIARWTATGRTMHDVVAEVCSRVSVPVFVQLHGPSVESNRREMEDLLKISQQIHPKLVATVSGMESVHYMCALGRKPLITTVASLNQAYMAAVVGASYIAPYVGRIEDAGRDTGELLNVMAKMYQRHQVETQIAAASIRTPEQASQALAAGADILVMGHSVFQQLLEDELTAAWIDSFEQNWRSFSRE